MTGYANALIQVAGAAGGRRIADGLHQLTAINTETIAKGRRGTSDQGNFKRKTAGQCS
jgi:hypothetical protein